MTATVTQITRYSLFPEWERLELLCRLLVKARENQEAGPDDLVELNRVQQQVTELREEGSAWNGLDIEGLSILEMDILSAVVAVEAEPKFALFYQRFYPGQGRPFITPALLQELLAFAGEEVRGLLMAISKSAPLRQRGLILMDDEGPLSEIRPGPGVTNRLLDLPFEASPPPGSLQINKVATWDDLVLSEPKMKMLKEFLLWIRHHDKVVHEWHGNETGGPVAMFAGPSGTGKTFAASVLANELGWPLYRVDLGMLVSKYIGETEKNLNRLFRAAHGKRMVLQFDEADSLMSKRGEVKEARDRYANMEVSHLLARIEEHRGPCILTTNLREHLDTAFYRRFQMVVEFSRPDAEERSRLWKKLFPPNAPVAEAVDLGIVGKTINLSGGNIKNAALHSAYLAAEDGCPVEYRHIAVAVWRELAKDGSPVADAQMGKLMGHLPEGIR